VRQKIQRRKQIRVWHIAEKLISLSNLLRPFVFGVSSWRFHVFSCYRKLSFSPERKMFIFTRQTVHTCNERSVHCTQNTLHTTYANPKGQSKSQDSNSKTSLSQLDFGCLLKRWYLWVSCWPVDLKEPLCVVWRAAEIVSGTQEDGADWVCFWLWEYKGVLCVRAEEGTCYQGEKCLEEGEKVIQAATSFCFLQRDKLTLTSFSALCVGW